MKQLGDKLVISPVCGSDACYESEFMTADGPVKTWLCMTSGYTSNTTMTLDSEALKQTLELTAELIKDLRLDLVPPGGGEKLAWFPTAITMPEKGMIFPEPIKGVNKLFSPMYVLIRSGILILTLQSFGFTLPSGFLKFTLVPLPLIASGTPLFTFFNNPFLSLSFAMLL